MPSRFWLSQNPTSRPGLYPIRIESSKGISNVLLFTVGTYPEITEEESLALLAPEPQRFDRDRRADPIFAGHCERDAARGRARRVPRLRQSRRTPRLRGGSPPLWVGHRSRAANCGRQRQATALAATMRPARVSIHVSISRFRAKAITTWRFTTPASAARHRTSIA